MFSFSKILAALVTAAAFVVSAGNAVAAPEVIWEVENRFRFYQTPEPFKAYLKVAKDTRLDSSSAFDGFINPPSDAFQRLKEVVNTSCLLNIRRIGWFNAGADAASVLQQLTEAGKPCAGLAANAETGLQKSIGSLNSPCCRNGLAMVFARSRAANKPARRCQFPRRIH